MSKRTNIWDDHSLVPNTTAALVLGMKHVAGLNFGAESHLGRGLLRDGQMAPARLDHDKPQRPTMSQEGHLSCWREKTLQAKARRGVEHAELGHQVAASGPGFTRAVGT
jgi:hypothetical protein